MSRNELENRRPKLPKGQAKVKIVPVRFAPEEFRASSFGHKLKKGLRQFWRKDF